MKYKLMGDIIRAGSISVEASSLEELDRKLDEACSDTGTLLLDRLKPTVVDECMHDSAFEFEGTIFDEEGNEVLLPSAER